MRETLSGYVEKIVYRNESNLYTVANLSCEGEETIFVGYFSEIGEGNMIEAEGEFIHHKQYGMQFLVSSYQIKEPESKEAIEKYLASGIIKGIGKALAARIVKEFGEKSFEVIEREPERLADIRGITKKKAREIGIQFEEKREFRDAMLLLNEYGVSSAMAMKIFKQYGARLKTVIKENPYRLADDINGIGFKTADEIALKVGIPGDSIIRYKALILYELSRAAANGHTYLPYAELEAATREVFRIEEDDFLRSIEELMLEKRVIRKNISEEDRIYNINFYYMELNVARKLVNLDRKSFAERDLMERRLEIIQKETGIFLEEAQKEAVYQAVQSGLLIITGGPGTGKTTTINTIINLFSSEHLEILLAAPTGRAAKRMTETTGMEAQTLHRLLELNGNPEDGGNLRFERNEGNPLEADVIIVDEVSMVDIYLMYSLLKAVPAGTRLILVGDVNQLPSVGPGNVLKDMIRSEEFNVVRLTKIFRQAAESDIITNAHKINSGEEISLNNRSKDFFMLKRHEAVKIEEALLWLITTKLPPYVDADPYEIQVLTPMRKGELGVENLNRILQERLNPPSPTKREKKWGDHVFRENDKVMQIKNNYQLEWKILSRYGTEIKRGTGIFNGDIGIIKEVNTFSDTITIVFDDERQVIYDMNLLDELELAYAITIHKSQGSEYPAVILPLLSGPRMLFNRNLLYTAVTRAKKCVMLVGSEDAVNFMIENEGEQRRYSGLKNAIKEIREADHV